MSSDLSEVRGTATNKYAKDFAVPPDFPDILSGLTREILRSQPQDIDKFAMEYFANELVKQKALESKKPKQES